MLSTFAKEQLQSHLKAVAKQQLRTSIKSLCPVEQQGPESVILEVSFARNDGKIDSQQERSECIATRNEMCRVCDLANSNARLHSLCA